MRWQANQPKDSEKSGATSSTRLMVESKRSEEKLAEYRFA